MAKKKDPIKKTQIRRLAMQVLFLWETQGQNEVELAQRAMQEVEDASIRRRALETASAAWEMRQAADRWVERVAPDWPPHRQPTVDRSILRLAVWELISTPTSPRVVIDEAIEIAREFSTAHSAAFINGVMDAILKEHQAMTGSGEPAPPASPPTEQSPQA